MKVMNITTERLAEIEQERLRTMSDPKFGEWVRSLNVSRGFVNPEGRMRAKEMMALWTGRSNELNSFSSILDRVATL